MTSTQQVGKPVRFFGGKSGDLDDINLTGWFLGENQKILKPGSAVLGITLDDINLTGWFFGEKSEDFETR
ncbi:MAG: hypothetical protein R2764_11730 [Bacteroidales bacterium]